QTGDKVLSSAPVYQTGSGLLGRYYYSTTDNNLSTLINVGSRTAAAAGLYHYTVKTSNQKEGDDTASTLVDIGFHYMAVDSNGNPKDAAGDGIADYFEDKNGNGTTDSGETSYARPTITLSTTPLSYTEKQQPRSE